MENSVEGPRSIRFRLDIWETTLLFQVIAQTFIVPDSVIIEDSFCDFHDSDVVSENCVGIITDELDEGSARVAIDGWLPPKGPPLVATHTFQTPDAAMRAKVNILRELYRAFTGGGPILEGDIDYGASYFTFSTDDATLERYQDKLENNDD